jgi:hypothetical protein
MSNNDLAVHLHFALFNGSKGFVLKPTGMLGGLFDASDSSDDYWPPPCDHLHIASLDIISLHNLPKVLISAKSALYRALLLKSRSQSLDS